MKKTELYDRVLLKNGFEASIVEIFKHNEDYLADVDYKAGTEAEDIKYDQIKKVLTK